MSFADAPPGSTIRDMLDLRAAEAGDRVSHVFPGEAPLTWGTLRDEAREIAERLAGLGVARGESVAMMLPNGRAGILCLMGLFYGGFRAALVNLVAGAEAMGYALAHSEARFVLLGAAQQGLYDGAVAASGAAVTPIRVGDIVEWPEGARGSCPRWRRGTTRSLCTRRGRRGGRRGCFIRRRACWRAVGPRRWRMR